MLTVDDGSVVMKLKGYVSLKKMKVSFVAHLFEQTCNPKLIDSV